MRENDTAGFTYANEPFLQTFHQASLDDKLTTQDGTEWGGLIRPAARV